MVKKYYTKLHEWQLEAKTLNHKCVECGRNYDLTVDHILPVWLIELCVSDNEDRFRWLYETEENFQFMCKYCNDAKRGKVDKKDPKVKELLKKLFS
jgi:5-methylcytosine-specific restriction endonuclease McrA